MNFQSISETYRKTEKQSVNEHSSDYEIVAKIFDELIFDSEQKINIPEPWFVRVLIPNNIPEINKYRFLLFLK